MIERFIRVENGIEVIIEVYLDSKEDKDFAPWIFSIFVKLNKDNIEFDLKQTLITTLQSDKKSLYVGNRIVDGWSELYFYTQNTKGLESLVASIFKDTNDTYQCNTIRDSSWDFFDKNIFPTDLELSLIQSQKIVAQLEEEGDIIAISREVEHYASFETLTQKQSFIDNALVCNFKFKDDISSEEFDNGVALIKEHNLTSKELEKNIAELLELIKDQHGEYELWSTMLVNEQIR